MKRIILVIVLLFACAATLHWLFEDWRQPPPTAPLTDQPEIRRPDAVAYDTDSVSFNEQGKTEWRIRAPRVEFFSSPKSTRFVEPTATVFTEDQSLPWEITAAEGTLLDDNLVQMRQDVVIMTRAAEATVQRIETEFLEMNLELNTVRTDQPVRIVGPGLEVDANGLVAELNSEVLQLTDGVKSVYEP